MKRQATLKAFGFTRSLGHRGNEVEIEVPRFVDDAHKLLKCSKCEKKFVNSQGLAVHLKCIHGVADNSVSMSLVVPSHAMPWSVATAATLPLFVPSVATTPSFVPSAPMLLSVVSSVATSSAESIVIEDDAPKAKRRRIKHDAIFKAEVIQA